MAAKTRLGPGFRGLPLALEPEDEGSGLLFFPLSFYPLGILVSSLNLTFYPFIFSKPKRSSNSSLFPLIFDDVILYSRSSLQIKWPIDLNYYLLIYFLFFLPYPACIQTLRQVSLLQNKCKNIIIIMNICILTHPHIYLLLVLEQNKEKIKTKLT